MTPSMPLAPRLQPTRRDPELLSPGPDADDDASPGSDAVLHATAAKQSNSLKA